MIYVLDVGYLYSEMASIKVLCLNLGSAATKGDLVGYSQITLVISLKKIAC